MRWRESQCQSQQRRTPPVPLNQRSQLLEQRALAAGGEGSPSSVCSVPSGMLPWRRYRQRPSVDGFQLPEPKLEPPLACNTHLVPFLRCRQWCGRRGRRGGGACHCARRWRGLQFHDLSSHAPRPAADTRSSCWRCTSLASSGGRGACRCMGVTFE
jgi:hypothetical protein